MSANNTYGGATTINGGTLVMNGTNTASAVIVNSGARLKGVGRVNNLNVNSGGILSPGLSPGTLTAGDTTWDTNTVYEFEINDFGGTYGSDPGWDRLDSTGTLTIAATSANTFTVKVSSLTYANVSGLASNFNNTLGYTQLIASAASVSGFASNKFTVDTSGFVNSTTGVWSIAQINTTNIALVYTYVAPIPGTNKYAWAGGGSNALWSSGANWDVLFPPTNNVDLIFGAATRQANTNDISALTIKTLTLTNGGWQLNGNSITLNSGLTNTLGANTLNLDIGLAATQFWNVASGQTLDANGVLSGIGGPIKSGAGTLTLGGVNTFSGRTYLDAGTLTIGSLGDLVSSEGIDLGSSVAGANATLSLAVGAEDLDRSISVKGGSGTRTLTTADNITLSGTLSLETNLTLTSSGGTATLSNTVKLDSSGNNDISIGGAGNVTLSGLIDVTSGASDVNKSGAGTLTISGNNGTPAAGELFKLNISAGTVYLNSANALGGSPSYTDKVNFNTAASTLRVGASMTHGSMGMTIDGVTANIDVDSGITFSVGGAVANGGSAGTVTKTGPGELTLTGVSTYSGPTTISTGTLTIGGSGQLGSGSYSATITNNALLVYNS